MRALRRFLVALAAVLTLAGCTASQGVPENVGSEFRFVEGTPSGEVIPQADRQTSPNVTGETLDGSTYDLSTHSGKIVVINFWASWCAPCRVEAPDLEAVYQTYQPQGVELLGVLVRDTLGQGQAYTKQVGLTYPSIFDPATKIALDFPGYPLAAIPSTLVIDKDGKVAATYIASVDRDSLTKTIETLLAE